MTNFFWLVISGIAILIAGIMAFTDPAPRPRVFTWLIAFSFYLVALCAYGVNYLAK
jgi:uncharacterized membrane protein HdeD (DUF308 family)